MSKFTKSVKTYQRLLKVSQQYWGIFLLGVLGTVVLSLVDAGFTWLVKPIINKGFIDKDEVFIHWLPLLVIFIFIVRGIAGFTSNYFINRVARNVVRDFRRMIFGKLLKIPAAFYDRHSSGHLLSTVIYNVEQVSQASSDALISSLREFSLLVGLILVMFSVSWQLTLLFLVICPLITWVVKWSSVRLRRLSSNVQQSVGEVTQVADEGIQAYKVIRLFGGQDYEYQKFAEATKRNQQRELKIVITNSIGTALVQLLISIPIAITLLFATMPSLHISPGAFASIIAAMIALLRPVRRLTMVNSTIQKGVAGAESIFTILDEPEEEDEGRYVPTRVSGHIQFNQVSFIYGSTDKQVLHDISIEIKPGQTVAIVGHSGSGKSTLIQLLPRFYDVTTGVIRLDGMDIRGYQLAALRQQFSLVSQETLLFDDTIAQNIAYGVQGDVSETQIIQAAKSAHAMEFIEQLPEGLNTVIGEDGVLLSGGQRQRIAIARALLKDAPILVLDEATSALDTRSERIIQQALDELMKDRTTLVIAHRLSTVENADWIIVMDKGRVLEQGTHRSLYDQDGIYASLCRMQFGQHPLYAVGE